MPETLSQKLQLLDIIGKDKNLKVHEALSLIVGAGTNSNTYIINQALEAIHKNIDELESRNALVDVNAAYTSESGGVEHFTGVVPNIVQYNQGMVLIFTIPQNNKGAISINLNGLGEKKIKKYNRSGELIDLQADDFVRSHKYFLEYSGDVFVTLCENTVQEIKEINSKIQLHTENQEIHTSAEERKTWNAKSVVTKSETNGSIDVDGKAVVVYTHPEGRNPHGTTKTDIGLGNVENERQYSEQNPPPYPVTSVNGKTGEVVLKLSNFENDLHLQTDEEVQSAVSNAVESLKDGVGENLDTLKKLAGAINNDPAFSQNVDKKLDTKANKSLDNLDEGVLLTQGKSAGLLDAEIAAATYETQTHASATYETKENVAAELKKKADKTEIPNKVFTATLSVDGWNLVSEGIYTQSITNENVTANDKLNLSPTTDSFLKEIMDAGIVGMIVKNDNGTLSVLLYGEQPKQEMTVSIEIVPTKQI
jgi:hypothetical protein